MSGLVDVLAEMDSAIEILGMEAKRTGNDGDRISHDALIDARDAVAAMIQALRSAEALAVCCMAVDAYSRDEIAGIARASLPTYSGALADARGSDR